VVPAEWPEVASWADKEEAYLQGHFVKNRNGLGSHPAIVRGGIRVDR
jgi:hypothetical protein